MYSEVILVEKKQQMIIYHVPETYLKTLGLSSARPCIHEHIIYLFFLDDEVNFFRSSQENPEGYGL